MPNMDFFDIAYSDKSDTYVIVGSYNNIIIKSRNLFSWDYVYINNKERVQYRAVIYKNRKFILIGNNGTVTIASDTLDSFESTNISDYNLTSITYSNAYYITACNGVIFKSKDLEEWKPIYQMKDNCSNNDYNLKISNDSKAVINGKRIIDLDKRSSVSNLMTIPTEMYKIHYNECIDWNDIYYNKDNNEYIAVGNYCSIGISDDLANWEINTLEFDKKVIKSITYHDGVYIAVGYENDGTRGVSFKSKDGGKSWHLRYRGKDPLYKVRYLNNKFIAIGANSSISYTTDSMHWLTLK